MVNLISFIMTLSTNTVVLLITILGTGLTAGLCFTWGNAVTPGLSRLDDLGYLQAFQAMNRAIINPMFAVIFFGPFLTHLLNLYLHRNVSGPVFWMLVAAAVLYIVGIVLITIFGNVPINEALDKTFLEKASTEQLAQLRMQFEGTWSLLHTLRTLTSTTSFILLLLSLIQLSK